MGKIDKAILEALATAMTSSVYEYDASAGTATRNICLVKMNFIKHFTEDVQFLNDHSEDDTFSRRYGNLIIRDMLEQLIEYITYYNNRRVQRNLGVLTPMEKHESYLMAA